jgi:Na+-driven multidrug efflux pump
VGNRLESFSYLTASSLAAASAAVVGQSRGAARTERSRQTARLAAGIGAGVTGLIGLSFFIFGCWMFQLFTTDPGVCAQGGEYMKVLALCQPFMGVEIALFGSFAGAGYTLAPTWISVGISLLRIPLGFWIALSLGQGLMSLAWIISLTCIVRALPLVVLYSRGRWLLVRL